MVQIRRLPLCSLWIEGTPKSFQGGRRARYTEQIKAAALEVMPRPMRSPRIDIDIFFAAIPSLRSDIDGVVYIDDRQVRSVRVVAFNTEDAFGIVGPFGAEALSRLLTQNPKEFLINIYEGRTIHGL
jgi:hypothetical protein